jgi:hypothetical protein
MLETMVNFENIFNMKRSYNKLIWLGLPLLIALIMWSKWDNWFYNPPEPFYHPSSTPDRILLTWSGDALTSREVTWQGDTLTKKGELQLISFTVPNDTLRYSSPAKIIRTSGGAASYFKAGINNLKPGENYRYRVANGALWSEWFTFKTGKVDERSYSYIYIGDVQDSVNGVSGQLFHRAYESLPNAAFMMFIGDMIERPHDAYWGEWFKAGGNLFRTVPVIATPGNHEYYKGLIQKLDERWMAHFAFPQNGPPNFLGRVCYWDYQQTRYISLDSNGIQTIPSALEQRSWLKEVLQNTHQRWIVIMMHHPIYSTSRGRDYFYLRSLLKPLFDRYNVDLVLEGHDHAYGRAIHIPNSGSGDKQGAVYVVTHASPKLYDIGFSAKMDKLATNTQMYQLIDVSNDSIRYRAYTTDGALFDGFTIHKDQTGNRSVTENAPVNSSNFLQPTKSFLRKSSDSEMKKYNQEMEAWEKSKL